MPKVPKISLHIFAISPKKHGGGVNFLPADKQKMIVSLLVYVARHAQSIQNNSFTISLQYVKENMKNEVDFLPADKHSRFLQNDTVI